VVIPLHSGVVYRIPVPLAQHPRPGQRKRAVGKVRIALVRIGWITTAYVIYVKFKGWGGGYNHKFILFITGQTQFMYSISNQGRGGVKSP